MSPDVDGSQSVSKDDVGPALKKLQCLSSCNKYVIFTAG
jgi:hypothetical protein